MTKDHDVGLIAWWTEGIEDLDREIGRLCVLCDVRILDPGVIERVLRRDASVCGTPNPVAFAKLHDMLMFYFANRQKWVDSVGQAEAAAIEAFAVEKLRSRFANLLGKWPPG